jgi:hypothetical protein
MKKTLPTPRRPRNWLAVLSRRRKAGVLRDRRAERGGARNRQRDWLAED